VSCRRCGRIAVLVSHVWEYDSRTRSRIGEKWQCQGRYTDPGACTCSTPIPEADDRGDGALAHALQEWIEDPEADNAVQDGIDHWYEDGNKLVVVFEQAGREMARKEYDVVNSIYVKVRGHDAREIDALLDAERVFASQGLL
jgi:hypothetical protein